MSWLQEDKLLLLCCRTGVDDKGGNKIDDIEIHKIDWGCFLEKAREEGVSPIVFLTLPEIVVNKDIIPVHVTDELKKDYYLTAKKNILTLNSLGKILDVFNKTGLNVIVLKGAALAETVYGNLALRPMSDVDLLVKKEDLKLINEELRCMGYFPADRPFENVDFTSTYLTSLDYRNPRGNSPSFHIHWHFVNSTIPNESYIRHINMEDIWRDAVKAKIANTETWVMSPHHLIIHLAEHALRVTHSLSKLIYFCDIDRSINYYMKALDWNLLVQETVKFNLNKMVYTTLFFSRYFIEARIPEDILLKLKPGRFGIPEKIFMRKTAQNKRIPGMSYLIHLSMNKGPVKKLRFVGRTLFPPKDILAQRSYISGSDMNYRYYVNRIREALAYVFKL